ncbi:MAG: zinc-binding dehydrogenase [Planctomycetes bacterium]|nr:zinc-binding dehydrogenase [Planctomycetota bacterium]
MAQQSEPLDLDRPQEAIRRLISGLSKRRKLPVTIGLPEERTFFTTRPMQVGGGDASPRVLLREALFSASTPVDAMVVDVIKSKPGSRKLASIVACDLNPLRLGLAERLGADRTVNAGEEDLVAVIEDMTGGDGVDVAIEYSGSEEGFNACFAGLAKGGDLRLVGAPPRPIPVDFTQWLTKCPAMQNIHGRRIWQDWERASELILSGKVDLTPIMSHTLPLADAVRGFELIRAGEAIKPLIIPAG